MLFDSAQKCNSTGAPQEYTDLWPGTSRDDAWIDCCLNAYTKNDPVPMRLYRMFGTSLRPDILGIANTEANAQ